jgi:microcystin degradation protein MlrC
VGAFYHETHTFLESRTTMQDCVIKLGDEMIDAISPASALEGVVVTGKQRQWQIIPSVDVRARPGAMLTDDVIQYWWDHYEVALRNAFSKGLDGLFLAMHGAMASEAYFDVEAELLGRIRKIIGTEIPIVGVTDCHANFSPAIAEYSNALITYRKNPHTDARETAIFAAELLDRMLTTGERPGTYYAQPPLMWAPPGTGTADEPMLGLENIAREIEATDPEVWAVNVHSGYSFADTPHTGVSFTINSIGSAEKAQQHLQRLYDYAMVNKSVGQETYPTPLTVVEQIRKQQSEQGGATNGSGSNGPILLVEPSDNIGGGSPGDGTGTLRVIFEQGLTNVGAIICDPEAVAQISQLPIGGKRHLSIGGKGSKLGGTPIDVEAELVSTSNGQFEVEDKQNHGAAAWGTQVNMGPCAVIHVATGSYVPGKSGDAATNERGVTILLTSKRSHPADLGQWRSQGVEPSEFDYILVKSAIAHKRAYDKISNQSYYVGTSGPCTSNLKDLPFKNIRRPIFPLDEI